MTKGSRLHENWVPSTDDVAYGRSLGLSEQAINGCAEDMRLWAGANANRAVARKLDWSKAFKGWLRRTAARQPWLKPPDHPLLPFGKKPVDNPVLQNEPAPISDEMRDKVQAKMVELGAYLRRASKISPKPPARAVFRRPSYEELREKYGKKEESC